MSVVLPSTETVSLCSPALNRSTSMPRESNMRWRFGITANTPIDPTRANGAARIRFATHAIMYPPLSATRSTATVSGIPRARIRASCDAANPCPWGAPPRFWRRTNDLIVLSCNRYDRRHLLAQRIDSARPDIADEIDDEHPLATASSAASKFPLHFLRSSPSVRLLGPASRAHDATGQGGRIECSRHALVLAVNVDDLEGAGACST